jgi:hypothetical protein
MSSGPDHSRNRVVNSKYPAGPCACTGNLNNCDDFGSQAQAQRRFDWCVQVVGTDVHRLDSDGDSVASEVAVHYNVKIY